MFFLHKLASFCLHITFNGKTTAMYGDKVKEVENGEGPGRGGKRGGGGVAY